MQSVSEEDINWLDNIDQQQQVICGKLDKENALLKKTNNDLLEEKQNIESINKQISQDLLDCEISGKDTSNSDEQKQIQQLQLIIEQQQEKINSLEIQFTEQKNCEEYEPFKLSQEKIIELENELEQQNCENFKPYLIAQVKVSNLEKQIDNKQYCEEYEPLISLKEKYQQQQQQLVSTKFQIESNSICDEKVKKYVDQVITLSQSVSNYDLQIENLQQQIKKYDQNSIILKNDLDLCLKQKNQTLEENKMKNSINTTLEKCEQDLKQEKQKNQSNLKKLSKNNQQTEYLKQQESRISQKIKELENQSLVNYQKCLEDLKVEKSQKNNLQQQILKKDKQIQEFQTRQQQNHYNSHLTQDMQSKDLENQIFLLKKKIEQQDEELDIYYTQIQSNSSKNMQFVIAQIKSYKNDLDETRKNLLQANKNYMQQISISEQQTHNYQTKINTCQNENQILKQQQQKAPKDISQSPQYISLNNKAKQVAKKLIYIQSKLNIFYQKIMYCQKMQPFIYNSNKIMSDNDVNIIMNEADKFVTINKCNYENQY